jgi:pimeloyl-ACP methyl ester carboxylesterase
MSDDPFDASSPSWIHSSLLVTFGIRLASILAGLFCIFGGILYAKQDSLLYFPSITGSRSNANNPRGYRHPKERGIEAEDCAIVCADGTRIHAWLLLFNTNGPTILFFHGNAGNIGLRLPNAVQMRNQLQVNVMLVEYRGYGDSDNVAPTETGLKLDGEAGKIYGRNDECETASVDYLYVLPFI